MSHACTDVLVIVSTNDELDGVFALESGDRSNWRMHQDHGILYHNRQIKIEGGTEFSVTVVVAETSRIDAIAALVNAENPSVLAICGACRGVQGKVDLGDVVIIDAVGSQVLAESRWQLDPDIFVQLQASQPIPILEQERWLLHRIYDCDGQNWQRLLKNPDLGRYCSDWNLVRKQLCEKGLIRNWQTVAKLTRAGRARVEQEKADYPDGFPATCKMQLLQGAAIASTVLLDIRFAVMKSTLNQGILLVADIPLLETLVERLRPSGKQLVVVKGVSAFVGDTEDSRYRKFACRASAEVLLAIIKSQLITVKQKPLLAPAVPATGYPPRHRDLAELEAMTKNQLLDALCKLSAPELAKLIFKLDIPTEVLPGENAPRADRVIKVLEWAEPHGRIAEVERRYLEIIGPSGSGDSTAHVAPKAESPNAANPATNPDAKEQVHVGIVVALQEEFRELLSMCGKYTQHKNEKLTTYRFSRGAYRIVAAFVGDMGQAQASRVAERMIDTWHPESIVVMGIAAGVHDDLRVGDVYIPPQAVEYMQDAKATPKPDKPTEFVLVPGAPARRADYALMDAVRNLEFGHSDVYKNFIDSCVEDLPKLLPDAAKRHQLVAQNLIRHDVAVLADGHVATGPVVGAAEAFTKWIRSHDRNVKALEMESAGVFMSAQEHSNVTRALAIRGISDYGDDRKKALDEIGGGALRKYAMRNAVRFLWALLDANALPQ